MKKQRPFGRFALRIENYFERVLQILHACLIIQSSRCLKTIRIEAIPLLGLLSGNEKSSCGGNEAAWGKRRRVAAQESAVVPAQSTSKRNG